MMPRTYDNVTRRHQVDSDGNLEWVERIIINRRRLIRNGRFHLTEQELRELLRLAYRNGCGEHQRVAAALLEQAATLIPEDKP